MKRLLLALGLVVLASPAPAQNAITQEGPVIQNSPMMFRGNNRARQGAPVGGAPTGQIVNTGDAVVGGRCDYSAPTDAAGGYYFLCIDAATGRIRSGGTKSPQIGLSIEINGNEYGFPGAGNGNVVGPTPTTTNEITSWNSTTGSALRQGAAAITDNKSAPLSTDAAALTASSQAGATAQQIYNQAVMGGTGLPFTDYSAVKGVNIVPSLSTINIAAGLSGYTLNNTVPVGQKTSSASVNAIAVCAADGSKCWGYNALLSDNPTLANTGLTAGTGKFLTNEFDLNITSPNSSGNGLAVGGTALPTNTTLAFQGFSVNKLWGAGGFGTGTALWANGFITEDACCAAAIKIGANVATGADKPSMPVMFGYRDPGGQQQNVTLASLNGKLFAGGSTSFGFATPNFNNPSLVAFLAGSMASTGSNIESQASAWTYLDAAGALQNYSIHVNASRTMVFQASVASTVAKFDFEGGLSVNSIVGVTCTAGTVTAATMTVLNGLVTHC